MRHILYTMFLDDCIKKLDKKYQEVIKDEINDSFLYANIIEIPLYYKMFTYKKNPDYKLYQKLHNDKYLEVTQYLKQEIIENNYDAKTIIFLYGYITHIIFDYYLESYISNILTINKKKHTMKNYSKVSSNIENHFYFETFNKKIKTYKINQSSLKLNEKTEHLINHILKDIFYSSMGISVYKISHKKFIKYQTSKFNPLGIKKIIYGILDTFTRRKKYSSTSLIKSNKLNTKIDYLNKNKNAWYLYDTLKEDKSFEELYDKAISDSLEVINILNEEIFYMKKYKNGVSELLNKIFILK